MLENGNVLVTETDAGRVFEATVTGEIVWNYINGRDKDEVGWVMGATRYPPEFAAIADTDCN